MTIFNDKINKPLYEELLVTIAGPLFQIIITYFLAKYDKTLISFSNFILIFNLFPIIPLDGSKLLLSFLSYFIYLKKSLKLLIIISYTIIILLLSLYLFYSYSLIILVSLLLLIFKINDETKNINYYYHKFLIERYLFIYNYKKTSIINNIDKMYKYRNNIIKSNKKIFTEKEYLKDFFDNNCKEY